MTALLDSINRLPSLLWAFVVMGIAWTLILIPAVAIWVVATSL